MQEFVGHLTDLLDLLKKARTVNLEKCDHLNTLPKSFKQFVTRRKEALGKKIQGTKILTEKTWLLAKLAER